MLKAAEKTDIEKIVCFCQDFPLGSRISGKLLSYGLNYDFFKVWFCTDEKKVTAVISSFENNITVCAAENADYDEIKSFLSFCPYEDGCADKVTFDRLGLEIKSTKQMYRYSHKSGSVYPQITGKGDLKQVYSLVSECIPDSFAKEESAYLSFLSDFTFRQRRNMARIKTYTENGKVLSCALTASESDSDAIISGVACDESIRGKGIGKKTVQSLADELFSENKRVYVIALNSSAQKFYEKIGFEKECEVCFF